MFLISRKGLFSAVNILCPLLLSCTRMAWLRTVSQWHSCRCGRGRLVCLFFSLPFLSPPLWPLSCLSLASVSHHEMMIKNLVCQYFGKQTSAKPTCRAETGLHRYCLAITCRHEEVNPREFFSLLIRHSCSFPKIVALTVKVAHCTRQGNPPLLWDSYAVLDAQLPWLLVLLLPSAWSVLGTHYPSSWFVGGGAAGTCHHFAISSVSSLLSSRAATVVLHFLLHGREISYS